MAIILCLEFGSIKSFFADFEANQGAIQWWIKLWSSICCQGVDQHHKARGEEHHVPPISISPQTLCVFQFYFCLFLFFWLFGLCFLCLINHTNHLFHHYLRHPSKRNWNYQAHGARPAGIIMKRRCDMKLGINLDEAFFINHKYFLISN